MRHFLRTSLFIAFLGLALAAAPARAQFDLSGGVGFYFADVEGFGIHAWPRYNINDKMQIGLQTGAFFKSISGAFGSSVTVTSIPLIATFTYTVPAKGKVQPFVGGGLGLFIGSVSGSTTTIPGLGSFESNGTSSSDFALNLHGGVNFSVSEKFYIQGRTGLDLILAGETAVGIPLLVGVGYKF